MNKNTVNVFIKSIEYLQELNKSRTFKLFEKVYKNSIKSFFRHCAVSICFRLHLKEITNKDIVMLKLKRYFENNPQKYFDIKHFERNLNQSLDGRFSDLFDIDVLFIKRLSSNRDRYSGHIAFPGGKVEKSDLSDYHTSVRETFEEIGIDLDKDVTNDEGRDDNDSGMFIKYLGPNNNFDLTIDFKFFVSSHIFLIIDPLKQLKITNISKNEVEEAFFVPLDYFLNLTLENQSNFIKHIVQDKLGGRLGISKLILNNRDDLLLFGMTLRKFIGVLNLNENNILYKEFLEFKEDRVRNALLYTLFPICKFLTNPYKVYNLIRSTILIYLSYKLLNYITMTIKF
jgi:8-oxo-dGTP pyrophosphatase MutT (NUDIX family)